VLNVIDKSKSKALLGVKLVAKLRGPRMMGKKHRCAYGLRHVRVGLIVALVVLVTVVAGPSIVEGGYRSSDWSIVASVCAYQHATYVYHKQPERVQHRKGTIVSSTPGQYVLLNHMQHQHQ